MTVPRFHSLLLVEEKLVEADYFLRKLPRKIGQAHGFELNAFLSAARSVTFLLQKELMKVPGFPDWWERRREEMRADTAMRFFLDLRNYSQKEGRISINGYGMAHRQWSHWFVDARIAVPDSLRGIQVADACRLHLAKLAKTVLDCAEAFPFYTCPHQALTSSGIRALSIDLDDLDEALGYSRGISVIDGFGEEDRLKFFRRHFDGVDFVTIRRLSRLKARRARKAKAT